MPVQVLLGAIAVAAAIPLLYYSVSGLGQRWLFGRRHSVLGEVQDVRQLVLEESAWERLVRPLTRSFGAILVGVSPT